MNFSIVVSLVTLTVLGLLVAREILGDYAPAAAAVLGVIVVYNFFKHVVNT